MEEFKSHIGIQLRSGDFDEQRLQILSTVGISFCHDTDDDLMTPCWLCVINLMALDMIGDPDGELLNDLLLSIMSLITGSLEMLALSVILHGMDVPDYRIS